MALHLNPDSTASTHMARCAAKYVLLMLIFPTRECRASFDATSAPPLVSTAHATSSTNSAAAAAAMAPPPTTIPANQTGTYGSTSLTSIVLVAGAVVLLLAAVGFAAALCVFLRKYGCRLPTPRMPRRVPRPPVASVNASAANTKAAGLGLARPATSVELTTPGHVIDMDDVFSFDQDIDGSRCAEAVGFALSGGGCRRPRSGPAASSDASGFGLARRATSAQFTKPGHNAIVMDDVGSDACDGRGSRVGDTAADDTHDFVTNPRRKRRTATTQQTTPTASSTVR